MGPKAQRGGPKGKSSEEEKDDALQAVMLADTFETSFTSIPLDRPRCLLPLVNVPLIEYTLEFLSNAGVQEVYLDGGPHVDQIEAFINTSKWISPASPFKKFIILKSGATSVGDVMRDLDQKQLFTRDFLVVSGDIVSNAPIEDALKAHRTRRLKDKKAIMTMLLREKTDMENGTTHAMFPTFVIDPTKERCLNYAEKVPNGEHPHLSIDADLLTSSEIDVRQDLIDCRIDICTPELLSLWTERFDDQTPRTQFLHGLLKDKVDGESIHNYSIHTYIMDDRYAARLKDLQSYEKISHDILTRKVSPLCLDNNIFSDQSYRLKSNFYLEDRTTLARSCHIGPCTAIGRETSIGAGTTICQSVIGRRCQIGKNVEVSNAYIWDDATIGNDVKILKAIVANEAVVGDRCTVGEGASVAARDKLTAGTVVTKSMKPAEPKEEYFTVYERLDISDTSSISSDDEEVASTPSHGIGSRSESFTTTMSDEDAPADRFHHEAVSTLFEHMQTDTAPEDVWIDLVSLWKSMNASDHQVRKAVAVAMMKHIQHQIDSGAASAQKASKGTLSRYRKTIKQEQTQNTVADQVDFLLQTQRDLVHRNNWKDILPWVAKDLYELDIFEEDVFLEWWEDERSVSDEDMRRVRESALPFINFLQTAESESSEDEESDD